MPPVWIAAATRSGNDILHFVLCRGVLRGIAKLAKKADGYMLFLIDEILSGTNSEDRRIETEAFVDAMMLSGAIGALSTHDLALTQVATE